MPRRSKGLYSGDSTLAASISAVVERLALRPMDEGQTRRLIAMICERRGVKPPLLQWSNRTCRYRHATHFRNICTGESRIKIYVNGRTRDTVIHEVAHHLAPPGAQHGPEFAKVFESLLREFAGEEVAE